MVSTGGEVHNGIMGVGEQSLLPKYWNRNWKNLRENGDRTGF
jgi:hypothetical protein